VIGANDVVNPAARHDKASPIYRMPILDADRAKTVMAIKRSMNPGFAGIENELYYAEKLPDALRRRQGGGRRSRQGTGRFGGLVTPRAIRIFAFPGCTSPVALRPTLANDVVRRIRGQPEVEKRGGLRAVTILYCRPGQNLRPFFRRLGQK
jgi:hypothetical protein